MHNFIFNQFLNFIFNQFSRLEFFYDFQDRLTQCILKTRNFFLKKYSVFRVSDQVGIKKSQIQLPSTIKNFCGMIFIYVFIYIYMYILFVQISKPKHGATQLWIWNWMQRNWFDIQFNNANTFFLYFLFELNLVIFRYLVRKGKSI